MVHIVMDGGDEVVIDLHRYLIARKGGVEGAFIAAGSGIEAILGDLCAEASGKRATEGAIGVIQRLKRALSQHSVLRLHAGDVASLGQIMLLALAIDGRGELHIGVI